MAFSIMPNEFGQANSILNFNKRQHESFIKQSKELGHTAKSLLLHMISFCSISKCRTYYEVYNSTQKVLGIETGMHRATVGRCIKQLEKLNYVAVVQSKYKNEHGKRYGTNRYRINILKIVCDSALDEFKCREMGRKKDGTGHYLANICLSDALNAYLKDFKEKFLEPIWQKICSTFNYDPEKRRQMCKKRRPKKFAISTDLSTLSPQNSKPCCTEFDALKPCCKKLDNSLFPDVAENIDRDKKGNKEIKNKDSRELTTSLEKAILKRATKQKRNDKTLTKSVFQAQMIREAGAGKQVEVMAQLSNISEQLDEIFKR